MRKFVIFRILKYFCATGSQCFGLQIDVRNDAQVRNSRAKLKNVKTCEILQISAFRNIFAQRRLGALRRAASFLDSAGRSIVHKAFVRSRMEYAPLSWMHASDGDLAKLDRVQKRA